MQQQQQAGRHWAGLVEILRQSLRPRNLLWLSLVIAILALSPFIKEELLLQFQCHLNQSHLAQENVHLMAEVKRARQETEDMRERVQLCQSDADSEHSRANRSYWSGVEIAVVFIFSVEFAVGISVWYVCCRCLSRFRVTANRQVPQQPMRLQWNHH